MTGVLVVAAVRVATAGRSVGGVISRRFRRRRARLRVVMMPGVPMGRGIVAGVMAVRARGGGHEALLATRRIAVSSGGAGGNPVT